MTSPYESLTFGKSLSLRVDGAIGAMSLSPNGRDAVLAGRRGLFIIDLDDPFTTPRWLHHITSWEVADVQWSPHHSAKPSWCISTSNQKALLWDLARPSNNAILNVLHRHTRAITDINFHPLDPEILATCSIDTFVYSWDMRTPRRPVGIWAEWRAGATQVKWNHNNQFQLASSHDHSFYLWDSRKGSLPILRIDNAHEGKINGLDFSGGEDKILTCSNDKSVKLWDLQSTEAEIQPSVILKADYPIARARSLPFGKDRCCGIMPLRGGEDSVHVVNYEALYENARVSGETVVMDATPDYSFKGHNGSIKDFLWRTRHAQHEGFESKNTWKEFQLVTWSSQDFDLKLWPHDEDLYDAVNYNPLHQKILDLLVIAEELDSDAPSASGSRVCSPQSEISEDSSLRKLTTYKYNTYCTEPPLALGDLSKDYNGDLLSSLALYKIKQSKEHLGGSSQLNHLNWISGVRMGRLTTGRKGSKDGLTEEDDGPSNLGEEVSIVGHKFPKLRFEKISVSTGELIMTLRGPLPNVEQSATENPPVLKLTPTDKERKDSAPDSVNTTATFVKPNTNNTSAPSASSTNTTSVQTGVSIAPTLFQNVPNTSTAPLHPPPAIQVVLPGANADTGIDLPISGTLANSELNQEQKLVFIRLEIKFPKMYPYLEEVSGKHWKNRRNMKQRKSNQIRFEIEETHELTPTIKKVMIDNLERISQFYSNKYNKFCLEPCLRHLMGDKIELDDNVMLERSNNASEKNLTVLDDSIEVGNEGWVDDLIDQHEAAHISMKDSSLSGDDEDYEDADLIPPVGDNLAANREFSMNNSTSSLRAPGEVNEPGEKIKHDSTPLPKGCGAVWSHTGQLVCFFIPKTTEQEVENKAFQKFNLFNFAENSLKSSPHQNHGNSRHSHSVDSDVSSVDSFENDENSSDSDSDSKSDHSFTDSTSDDSFSNDWDEMLQDDVPSRSRIPGMFKGTVGLGQRYLSDAANTKNSMNRTASGGGTGSNYKSSAHGDNALKNNKKTKKTSKKGRNIVSILDFKHLVPDKYDLACEYRVLGDRPENLARYNSEVALDHGYREISDVWKIVEMVLIKDVRLNDVPDFGKDFMFDNPSDKGRFFWGNHPFGHSWLVDELFKYFEKTGNLQMLAMLACILFENPTNIKESLNGSLNVPIHTPYSALPPPPSVITLREYGMLSSDMEIRNTREQPTFQSTVLENASLSRKLSSISVRNDTPFSRSIPSSHDHHPRSASPSRVSSFKKGMQATGSSFAPFMETFGISEQNSLKNARSLEIARRSSRTSLRKGSKSIPLRKGILPIVTSVAPKWRPRLPPTFTIEMKNIEPLDLFDDMYTAPLLTGLDRQKINSYRQQYADMLYVWGLPYHRIKILKFNFPDKQQSPSEFEVHKCSFGFRFRKALSSTQLLLTPITPIASAGTNAWNTRKRNKLQYCGLCGLLVSKRVVICTHCEHILHSHCAADWWSTEENEEEETAECPTGCGCHCLELRI